MLQIDKIEEFAKRQKINTFGILNVNHAPSGYNCHKTNDYLTFYEIVYDKESGFPRVEKSIKMHKSFGLKITGEKNLIARYSFVVSLLHISITVSI